MVTMAFLDAVFLEHADSCGHGCGAGCREYHRAIRHAIVEIVGFRVARVVVVVRVHLFAVGSNKRLHGSVHDVS